MSDWRDDFELDLAWREVELFEMKRLIRNQPDPSTTRNAMLRAIWAMLYAHYEGFCLGAMQKYLEWLEASGIPRILYQNEITRFSLEHHMTKFRKNSSFENIVNFATKEYLSLMSANVDFPRVNNSTDVSFGGRSNLWPTKLSEALDIVCIPRQTIQRSDARLYLLVDRRNSIAHGKQTPIASLAEYEQYEVRVIDVMHELACNILDAAKNRLYLLETAKHNETARMAYKVWDERGRPWGMNDENWREAERRLENGERP